METILTNISPTHQYQQGWQGHSAQQSLCFEWTTHTWRIGVQNRQNAQWVWLEEYSLLPTNKDESILPQLQRIAEQSEVMQLTWWDTVSVIVQNQSFTLIPAAFFKREFMSRYLHLARGSALQPDEEGHFYWHEPLGAYNVFSAQRSVIDWLRDTYPFCDLNVLPHSSVLIEQSLVQPDTQVSVWIDEGAFTILFVEGQRLLYCNRFLFQSTSDLVYYVLFVWQELGLQNTDIPLKLYGNVKASDEICTELRPFFEHLTLATAPSPELGRYAGLLASLTLH